MPREKRDLTPVLFPGIEVQTWKKYGLLLKSLPFYPLHFNNSNLNKINKKFNYLNLFKFSCKVLILIPFYNNFSTWMKPLYPDTRAAIFENNFGVTP